jgi:hypothetical protein
MLAITLPENIVRILDIIPGETREDKLMNLLVENITSKLRECEDQIITFEAKYGMSFEDFEHAWKEGTLGNLFSYPLEKDYMEWEGFYLEKKKWLFLLKQVKDSLEVKE